MSDAHGAGGSLARARQATRAQFAMLGLVAGMWGVHVPSLAARYALDERRLSLALLAVSAGSVLALFLAGRVVGRLGARGAAVAAGSAIAAALALTLVLPSGWLLPPVLVLLGAGESVFDVAINAEGTELESRTGRAVMSGFHGMFSLGAMGGSAAAAALIKAGVPAAGQLAGAAVVVALGVAIAARGMLPVHAPAGGEAVHFAWPRGTLLVIGLLVLSAMLAEGVMYNWSVLYVQQELATPQQRAALAYVSFAGATAAMRFAGDAVRTRVSERTMLVVGPLVSAAAMAVVLLVARPWAAIAGFALVGAGLATVVPLLYNAATRVPGVTRAAAIAAVSSIGYVGFLVGPPIIGGIAHATTLTIGMATLVVAAAIVAAAAGRVPAARVVPPARIAQA